MTFGSTGVYKNGDFPTLLGSGQILVRKISPESHPYLSACQVDEYESRNQFNDPSPHERWRTQRDVNAKPVRRLAFAFRYNDLAGSCGLKETMTSGTLRVISHPP